MKKEEKYSRFVQARLMMDAGETINSVHQKLHIGKDTLLKIRPQYVAKGYIALIRPDYIPSKGVEEKERIVLDRIENGLSLQEIAVKHNVSIRAIQKWTNEYKKSGIEGLQRKNNGNKMKRKRQRTQAELDELEMLRRRNEYLEAENALLKKVKALVEEREARQRAIGREPSKN